MPDTKYCITCGTPNPFQAGFCISCGAKFPDFTPGPGAASAPAVQPAPAGEPRSDFITLSCPNCGGKLQLTADIERFACQFCGHEHIVRRSGGVVALEPVMQAMGQINQNISQVGAGLDRIYGSAEKQAAEAAIIRVKQEIADIQKLIDNSGGAYTWGLIVVLIAGFGAFGFFLAADGICYRFCEIIAWFLTGLTILFILLFIFSAVATSRYIAKQKALIINKEVELNRLRQIVER